ncbi:MAG: hypothetical protein ACFB4I_23985 [Cyanophyceae cyanobacterium]
MKTLIATALIASVAAIPEPLFAQPPATTYQPGFWQPVARVDLSRPVEVRLINQTGLDLDYGLSSDQSPPQRLAVGETVVLEGLPVPAYVLINPESLASIQYDVSVTDNVVSVTIKTGDPSNTTFNINEAGAIYVY